MTTPQDIHNREHWLEQLVQQVVPRFRAADLEVPPVHISVGFPSKNALGRSKRRVGECWEPQASTSGLSHVFVSPVLVDPVVVAETVIHELIHAVFPKAGHKGPFVKAMGKVGLVGKPTSTEPGPELVEWLNTAVLPTLGNYPHAALVYTGKEKKQRTRQLKVACEECGYTCRTTKKWLEQLGPPLCPVVGHGVMVAEERDEEAEAA